MEKGEKSKQKKKEKKTYCIVFVVSIEERGSMFTSKGEIDRYSFTKKKQ